MFTVARTIVKHKLLVAALLLAGYFLFAGNKEAPQPKSAWDPIAATQPAMGQAKEPGLTDKAIALVYAGARYAGVEEYLPTSMQEQAIGGLNKAGDALTAVNKNQE